MVAALAAHVRLGGCCRQRLHSTAHWCCPVLQVVLEGFLNVQIAPWLRRLLTRLVSIVPAALVAGICGTSGAGKLLVISQVVLSLTLVFAVAPLTHFTCSKAKMGPSVNHWTTTVVAWVLTVLIAVLNGYLIIQAIRTNSFGSATSV